MNNYIICTVQRSGKSWIAETLNMLGIGYAIELLTEFDQGSVPKQELLQVAFDNGGMYDLARYFAEQSIEAGLPCVSMTLRWSDFDAKDDFEIIYHSGRARKLNALIKGLGPCIVFFLKRRDLTAQAISHFLANRSGYYHSPCPEDRRSRRASVRYDGAEIRRYVAYTQRYYEEWENLFEIASVAPEVLYYEDFVGDPIQHFGDLAKRIAERGFKPETITAASAFQNRVKDEIDHDFGARYLAGE